MKELHDGWKILPRTSQGLEVDFLLISSLWPRNGDVFADGVAYCSGGALKPVY